LVFAALFALIISVGIWARLLVLMQSADFWEFQIRAFERADRASPPPPGAILFVGSSSIRYWRSLEQDFAPLPVLNRGFGGSHLAHVNHFVGRIVLPYRPRAVVVYAGENDLGLWSRKTPDDVLEAFNRLVATIQASLPTARIYFLAIKCSPLRRSRWKDVDNANRLIRESTPKMSGVSFIDVATPLLDANGKPRTEYLPWYRLHLTEKGYKLWASILLPVLEADLASCPERHCRPSHG